MSAVTILDGAVGTMLMQQTNNLLPCEKLNLSRPELVEEVHRAYLKAGAQVIRTNSFGANRISLARYGLGDLTAIINQAAVTIARRARRNVNGVSSARIAGSIGPIPRSGFGLATVPCQPETAYAEQAKALIEAGVDMLMCETFQTQEEIAQVLAAVMPEVRRADRVVPVAVCLSPTADSDQTADFAASIYETTIRDSGVAFFGFNCGDGPDSMVRAIVNLRGRVNLPIMALPSAGMPIFAGKSVSYPVGIEEFCLALKSLVERGQVAGVGGCCGTTPAYIEALVEAIRGL